MTILGDIASLVGIATGDSTEDTILRAAATFPLLQAGSTTLIPQFASDIGSLYDKAVNYLSGPAEAPQSAVDTFVGPQMIGTGGDPLGGTSGGVDIGTFADMAAFGMSLNDIQSIYGSGPGTVGYELARSYGATRTRRRRRRTCRRRRHAHRGAWRCGCGALHRWHGTPHHETGRPCRRRRRRRLRGCCAPSYRRRSKRGGHRVSFTTKTGQRVSFCARR